MDQKSLIAMRAEVDRVHISDEILKYIVRLISATRKDKQISQGASPRATLALAAASRAVAFLRGRDYVLPEDVQCIWREAIAHRLILAPAAEGTTTALEVASRLLRSVEPPRIH